MPQLEAALVEAAERQVRAGRMTGRRWSGRAFLALAATLGVSGVALAASGLLSSGAPVPDAPPAQRLPLVPRSRDLTLARVRVSDPDGGPPWGLATYRASERGGGGEVTCVVVGRVLDGKLGVVGRDGVFGDDGRFHAISPLTLNETVCGGHTGPLGSLGPPIPASAYTGPVGTKIGGCRERVDLSGPTVSPETRRKLRGVPECPRSSLRLVIAGLGGPEGRLATVTAHGVRQRQRVDPADGGAYLFVLPGATVGAEVQVTDSRGRALLRVPR